MNKLNSRLKKQFISADKPTAITAVLLSKHGKHEETMTYIDLISYSRKHGLADNLTYTKIWERIIEDWNKIPKNKNEQRKIIHLYEVYDSKMYIKL